MPPLPPKLKQPSHLLTGPLPPKPPALPPKAKVVTPGVKPAPLAPVMTAAVLLSADLCPYCGSKFIARPMRQLCVCSSCGKQWPMGKDLNQRPVTRADIMGSARHGSPFRY